MEYCDNHYAIPQTVLKVWDRDKLRLGFSTNGTNTEKNLPNILGDIFSKREI